MERLWDKASTNPVASAVLLLLALTICVTRILTGLAGKPKYLNGEGLRSVGMLPYWIPFLGHLFSFIAKFEEFLQQTSYRASHGIFSVNLAGSVHNVIYTPSLIQNIFQQRAPIVNSEAINWYIMVNVFGADRRYKKDYFLAFEGLLAAVRNNLLREPSLSIAVDATVKAMQEEIPNLVSFCQSPVDQNLWERTSSPITCANGSEAMGSSVIVEVSLFPLIRNFVGHISMPSLMGEAFMEYYPTVLDDIWALDEGFNYLAIGLPRWFPVRSVTKAHLARARLNAALAEIHTALDTLAAGGEPGPEWRDLSDVSPVMLERNAAWRSHRIRPNERGPGDLGILWAMHANANNLVFWILVRMWATPGLVERVREEIEPFVQISQPMQTFGIHEAPRMKIGLAGLLKECPLLKSCYLETLRLDSRPASVKKIERDFIVRETRQDVRAGAQPESYLLKAGTYINIPHAVHQLDPRFFEDPTVFKPGRFLVPKGQDGQKQRPRRQQEQQEMTAQVGTLKPWGGGASMCKGRMFAEREVLAFVAGILVMWDLEPVTPRGWVVPAHRKTTGVAVPSMDVRVRLRRRHRSSMI